jgi:hypothetical protein
MVGVAMDVGLGVDRIGGPEVHAVRIAISSKE